MMLLLEANKTSVVGVCCLSMSALGDESVVYRGIEEWQSDGLEGDFTDGVGGGADDPDEYSIWAYGVEHDAGLLPAFLREGLELASGC
jgi:hypothetical protein